MKKITNSPPKGGKVRISDEVVSKVTYYAAREIEGVAEISGILPPYISGRLTGKNGMNGISVKVDEQNKLKIDLSMKVHYGVVIPSVCRKVQESVASAVKAMTGLQVGSVNVQITSVIFDE